MLQGLVGGASKLSRMGTTFEITAGVMACSVAPVNVLQDMHGLEAAWHLTPNDI